MKPQTLAVLLIGVLFVRSVESEESYENGEFIKTNLELDHVPDIPEDAIKVRLSDNDIATINGQSFRDLTELTELYLSGNDISHIEDGSFINLGKLTVLELARNRLTILTSGTFTGLPSLRHLVLNDNLINTIQKDTFYRLSALEGLGLPGNNLTELRGDMFSGLGSLKALHLDRNRLSTLPADVFTGLPRPLTLAISDPQIQEPSGRNPLQCDCRLSWLQQEEAAGTVTWFRDHADVEFRPVCVNDVTWDTWADQVSHQDSDPGNNSLAIALSVIGGIIAGAVITGIIGAIYIRRRGVPRCISGNQGDDGYTKPRGALCTCIC